MIIKQSNATLDSETDKVIIELKTEDSSHPSLSVLPSRDITLVRQSESGEAKAVINVTLGHGSVLHGSKDLPAVVIGRASHEAGGIPAVESVVVPGLSGDVGEAADGGTGGNHSGVGLGEAQCA